MVKKDKIIVLSIDRDDDIGRKTSFSGPIVGKANVLKCATEFALSDPEDSDVNGLFQAIRVYEEVRNKHEAQIAALTGNINVGVESDKRIAKQLDTVLKRFDADYAIIVTDGAEDEHILPIIQSKVPILSVKRIIVKQSEKLESTYYQVKDFINESLENPKFARIVFGLPAIILILLGIFGIEGFRVVIGVLGAYLFIKGFKLEGYISRGWNELHSSFTRRRLSFFFYLFMIVFFALGTFRGITVAPNYLDFGLFEIAASYLSASIYFYFISGIALWMARNVTFRKRSPSRVAAIPIFGLAIAIVVFNSSELIIRPDYPIIDFIYSTVFAFIILFAALIIEWKA
ncbi:MAG: DUF373 family protein [Candidatus Aenigmatarchaeota archaeon]